MSSPNLAPAEASAARPPLPERLRAWLEHPLRPGHALTRAGLLYRAAAGLLLVGFAAACFHGVAAAWRWGHNGYNGAAFSHAARNSLRFELLAQAQYHMALTPPPLESLYTRHPMMLHAHLIVAHATLGFEAWVGRLIPALYSALCGVMIFSIARRYWDRTVALVAVALFALTPLNLIFANMIDHEQGAIFWCLVLIDVYLRWLARGLRRHFIMTLVAVTCAAQFDWPGYYLAFFLAVHAAAVGLGAALRRRRWWSREWTWVAVFSAVVLVNFFGFFGWIYSIYGDLDIMFSSFDQRSTSPEGYVERLWERSLDLQGFIPLLLVFEWLRRLLARAVVGAARRRDLFPLCFLLIQAIHSSVFQEAGFIHSYWTYYLSPVIALGGAELLVCFARWLGEALGRHARTLRPGARLLPRAVRHLSVAAVIASVLYAQSAHAWRQWMWGSATGSATYVSPYHDWFWRIAWARDLGQRYARDDTRYLLHASLGGPRIEFLYYLDAPHRPTMSLRAPARPDLAHVILLVDLHGLSRPDDLKRLDRLVRRHPTTVWDRRFVAIDTAVTLEAPAIEALVSVAEEPSLLWRWLAYRDHPPFAWRDDPEGSRALQLFTPPAHARALTFAGNERGGALSTWLCPPGQALASLEVGVNVNDDDDTRLLSGLRPVCRAASPGADGLTLPTAGPWRGDAPPDLRAVKACGDDAVAVGVHGRSGALIDSVGLVCAPLLGAARDALGSPSMTTVAGGEGGRPFQRRCGEGEVVVALRVRAGVLIDALAPSCAPLDRVRAGER